ncbi:RNA-binding protein 26 isoform X2 [Copidosoma floridanum]|uniref:RNA-binding protein 26 isoform X2 n=1 Tax=Copidosoma floridanum TaxID=29053 RepID=UPI0006C99568|nr:RNA-binding protein 26 isoform X2 [Copidosoma floridanum]
MLIENPEQFKAWLTSVLEPLCDADPAALAKYVYALVKKDKTLEELRGGMVEQLDVFLQQETPNFVELLFKTLETQDYLVPDIKEEEEDGSKTPPTTTTPQVPQQPLQPQSTESSNNAPMNTIIEAAAAVHINGSAPQNVIVKREARKSDSEKEEKERDKRPRSRGRVRSRTRSRSRSWERDRRRSRSRDHSRRDRERDRSRQWRNKSPPMSMRRHDRRRTRSRSNSPLRSRLRDGPDIRNDGHRGRFRNRSPTPIRSRSRSRSLERIKKMDRHELSRHDRLQDGCTSPGGGTPTQDSNHGDVDMRLSTTSQSIQSVVVAGQGGNFQPKRRCRDFDEKGYCMRGDLCPYDHGTDPVVLEDVALSRVLTFGPHGGQAPGSVPVAAVPEAPPGSAGPNDVMTEYNPDAPSLEPQMPWSRHPMPPGPVMYGRGQRELISVPVAPHANVAELPPVQSQQQQPPAQQPPSQQKIPHHQHHSQQQHAPSNPLKRKQAFDFNRLGPKQRAGHNAANCSLELKKVPRSLNNITQLNNHFSKFGKIVNIQVNFGGDPEAALVTFQMPSEAKSAYRSTEAVLNNRFIKVFWHNNNVNNNSAAGAIENVPPKQVGQRPSVKDRLGATMQNKVDDNEYVPARRATEDNSQQQQQQKPPQQQPQTQQQQQQQQHQQQQVSQPLAPKTTIVPAPATREDKVLAIKKTQEMLAAKETLKKKQEEKRKEAIKLTADLRKRKQELLDKQLSEMKMLIDRAEKNPDQKETIMTTIKTMQQSIDNLRKDLAVGNNGQNTSVATKSLPKTREQAQKEILDAELDLITAQQEGQDSAELQKRLLELRTLAATISLNSASAGRGARALRVSRAAAHAFRGRGRGASFTHVSVDHRPTNLLVSGYETEEKADVLAHFKQFGEIVNQIVDDATPSIVINYKSRKEAELAMSKGRNFQDRVLSITWVSGHHLHRGTVSTSSTVGTNLTSSSTNQRTEQLQPIMTDEEIDLENIGDEEALLLDEGEEEEDEDGESRSWRR